LEYANTDPLQEVTFRVRMRSHHPAPECLRYQPGWLHH
jgi:hypothetical protein